MICFDVDGTLVHHPTGMVIWEVLNLRFGGTVEQNHARYAMYRRGEIRYDEWVELDVEDWVAAGASRQTILESVREFELVKGACETVSELKARGYHLAVISGTLDIVLDTLFPDHPFDDVYTNRVFFDEAGNLCAWQATPFDGHGKPDALRVLCRKHNIDPARAAYIGDGENDVPLIGVPGYLIAFHPRSSALEAGADLVMRDPDLSRLLDIFV